MKNKRLAGFVTVLITVALLVTAPTAFAVSWVDWPDSIVDGSGSGIITLGSDTVDVGFSGAVSGFSNTNYWYAPAPLNNYNTLTYGSLSPSGMIEERQPGSVTLIFSKPVVDLYIALVSVGQPKYSVGYTFLGLQNPIEVYSYGYNDSFIWSGGPDPGNVSGNTFIGTEFSGVLKLPGTYSNLTFSFAPVEFWHGFNIGVASVAAPPPPQVPEPTTMLLLGLGLMGLAGVKRKVRT